MDLTPEKPNPRSLKKMPVAQSSHPAIRFEPIPVVEGKLHGFNQIRPTLLDDVVRRSFQTFSGGQLDLLLGEALYQERFRLKRSRPNLFTRERAKRDKVLWNHVQGGLLKPSAIADRKILLEHVLNHYAEEIGGRFNPKVYNFSIKAVPWGFNWLLNAASVQRFLPWGMTQALESRLEIVGEVPALQNLAKRGTILLVPTHQSNIDSVLIGYVIYLMSLPPFAYGAGLNLFSNPVLSFFMSRLGAYTVDRQKSNALYKEVLKNYSTSILKQGVHSIFFPGGGRSRSGAIESKVKLGLLGTGLEAQLENLQEGRPNPNVYIVPMVTSYNFVLEAGSLVEDYLAAAGKGRFLLPYEDESDHLTKMLSFFWKLFSAQNTVTVRIGKPLDVFGNAVDEEGRSIGPNGTIIDPVKWLTTCGKLQHEPQRDREYTHELGRTLVERYHRENTVLSSHLAAFSLFETLRLQYPELDLYRFLRLSLAQRSIPLDKFLAQAEVFHRKLTQAADHGRLFLSEDLKTSNTRAWVEDGIRKLGFLHEAAVIKVGEGAVWTEDLNLLYYYRNRLAGYGLSILSEDGQRGPGEHDRKGFLA